ncbi:hypothetical protein GJ744_006638 [Endocarpon pusillum]|uniref:Uncharacterized protein n=1 Tax=Endocarpon pusillum TaxID=364733 RepID=A0A8H7AUZ7_9EURO|nr:hypothetical protein GJ744_006638 [Endocarpon pusillum]
MLFVPPSAVSPDALSRWMQVEAGSIHPHVGANLRSGSGAFARPARSSRDTSAYQMEHRTIPFPDFMRYTRTTDEPFACAHEARKQVNRLLELEFKGAEADAVDGALGEEACEEMEEGKGG